MTTYNSPFAGDVIQPTDVSYAAYSISADLTLVWPINGNVSTDVAARIMDITPSTSGLSVYMPPANQVSVGQDALIKNPSAYALDILDNDGNVITTIDAGGQSTYIYLTDNGSVPGTWSAVHFGTSTSSVDAAALAGYGLLAISSTLNQSHPTSGFPDQYEMISSDRAQAKVWVGGSGDAYLPVSSTVGNNWFFILKNNGTGSLNLYTQGLDTIDGQTYKLFQPNESAFIICTGTEYISVGYGTSANFLFTAITKSVTSGTYTLATAEATSIIQEYVGSLTGNVTVQYPPVVALYVISNQTTDNGYTFTVTTGAVGAATAEIPAGNQVTLICDGTNFFNANTVQAGASVSALADGSVANPSLYFALESSTGVYRPTTGEFGVTVLGTNRLIVSAAGITVAGSGTFTGGISGGDFN